MKKLVIRFNAPVILTFALLSLTVLLLGRVTGGVSTYRCFCIYRSSFSDPLTYVRLFGHVLGHTGYSHYMGNMLLLLLVGPTVESRCGSHATLLFLLLTAAITGAVHFAFFPGSTLLGASGIVFMLIVLSSFADTKKGGIPITMILVVVLFLGREIIDALVVRDNVSQLTHIVGGVCGLVFGFSEYGRKNKGKAS